MRGPGRAGAAVGCALVLAACGGSESDEPTPSSGPVEERAALTQEQTLELMLTEEEFPLEGFTREEPVPVSLDLAVLDASALPDSEELTEECRAAAALARATPPPEAGSQVSFVSASPDAETPGREVTVIVFSTAVAVNYFAGYTDQAEVCGTVNEGGRVLEFGSLETEGLEGYTVGTDIGGVRLDLLLAGRSVGSNHVVVTGLDLTEEDAATIVDAQVAQLSAGR